MKFTTLFALAAVSLTVTAAAFAVGQPTPWTVKDMKTAIRAISYPKPHPVKLTCKGLGTPASAGFASFRCVATYRHHRVSRFYTGGRGRGGWLCAGRTLAECSLLKHGFVTSAAVAPYGLSGAAQLAARGYMDNRYGMPDPIVYLPCPAATDPMQRTYCYQWTNNSVLTVTITLKAAKGGYVVTATAATNKAPERTGRARTRLRSSAARGSVRRSAG